MLGFLRFVRVQKLPALAVAHTGPQSRSEASAVGAPCWMDGSPRRHQRVSRRQYPSFVIEESSRALQQTHAYDELRRPRPLDIILTVAGMCSSGAHGEHCGEWQCVETYVLCDLDLLGLPVMGLWCAGVSTQRRL